MQHEIRVHKQNKILYDNDRPLNNMYGGKIKLRFYYKSLTAQGKKEFRYRSSLHFITRGLPERSEKPTRLLRVLSFRIEMILL